VLAGFFSGVKSFILFETGRSPPERRGREGRGGEGRLSATISNQFTPDGRRVISGSYDDALRLWELESGANQ